MKRTFYFLAIIFSLMTAYAQDTKEVLSKGFGTTVDLATQNALSQAVREAVGALVDEETLIKNDELIEEKILTFSNGIVQDYKIVKEPRKNAQGLIEITIKATVKSNLLKKKLEEAKIVQGTVENGEEVWRNAMAQIVTEAQRNKNSIEVIKKLFKSIKPEQFLNVTFIDAEGRVNEEAKLDIKTNVQDKTATISINAVIGIDHEKYFNELFPYVKQTLDYVCEEKYDSLTLEMMRKLLSFNDTTSDSEYYTLTEYDNQRNKWKIEPRNDGKHTMSIYLQTNKRPSKSQIIFTKYVLAINENIYNQIHEELFKAINRLSIIISIYDKNKEIVLQKEVVPRPMSFDRNVRISYYDNRILQSKEIITAANNCLFIYHYRYDSIFILPMLTNIRTSGVLQCSNQIPFQIQIQMPLDDIKDIGSFDAKIAITRGDR